MRVLKAIGIFLVVATCLVALLMLAALLIVGVPHLAGYLAALLGLGQLAEVIIAGFFFMALPSIMITYILITNTKE